MSPALTAGQFVHTNGAAQAQQFYRVVRIGLADYYGSGATNTNSTGTATIAVSPSTANRGSTLTVTFTLSASASPVLPPVNVVPSSVMIGALAGTAITRPNSTTVTAQFSIPANAIAGGQSVVITFPGPGGGAGPSYTQANGFTIN